MDLNSTSRNPALNQHHAGLSVPRALQVATLGLSRRKMRVHPQSAASGGDAGGDGEGGGEGVPGFEGEGESGDRAWTNAQGLAERRGLEVLVSSSPPCPSSFFLLFLNLEESGQLVSDCDCLPQTVWACGNDDLGSSCPDFVVQLR